ncbi:VCBS domain-containing protein [Caballeronia humi]|nr:VCBS domain-containing protein [Caballeronia humi]
MLDSRVENSQALLAQLPANTRVLVIDSNQNAIPAISAALATMGKADSIQIFSHGASGQFTLGNQIYTGSNIAQMAETLAGWRNGLNKDADIELYGCNVGAGTAGRALVQTLARVTGASVGASNDNTGSASHGGDWTLEVTSGTLDKPIALSASALAHFDGLLADASPTTTLSAATSDVLLGDQFTFDVSLTNASSQVGYAPYIDLLVPATGKDGNDGVSFVSASYLGQAVTAVTLTFDANGNATHPLAKDATGNPLVINAATFGLRAGDQLVVLELPFASVSQGQPAIPVQVTARLSNLADTAFSNGTPDLTIEARGGFQFGNDELDNPTTDPTLVESSFHGFAVHPTVVTLQQSVNMTEGETVSGPNFVHTETVTASPAPGQTLSNVVVSQDIPANVQVTAITPGAGGTLTSLTLWDGSVITNPAAIALAINSDSVFIRSYSIAYATLAAPQSTVVSFYVPDTDATGQPVIDPVTGSPVTIAFGTASGSGNWVPLDPRDLTPPATSIAFSGTGDGTGTTFIAKSVTLEKQVVDQTDTGHVGLSPGDTLAYTLDIAISDYFAAGQTVLGQGQFVITDRLSDGQTLTGTPTFTYTVNGVTQTIALIATSTPNADGTTTLTFDIGTSIRNASGQQVGGLNGDLAFDDVLQGATSAAIGYNAVIAQRYTTAYTQSDINEGDSLGNNATVTASLLADRLNLTGGAVSDQSATVSTIPTDTVDIQLVSVNGATPPASGELNPGDIVTFSMSYDLVTGDYEQFQLAAYLPLPLLNPAGTTWTQGTGVGQWSFGAGNTNPAAPLSVTDGAGNSLVFDFGSFATSATSGSTIQVQFTMRVGDQPYADARSLDVLAQSSQVTTIAHQPLVSSDVAVIASVAEPVLALRQGVVASSEGTITGTTGTWSAPGTTGVPFAGTVTDIGAVNGDVSGIDAGDTLRLATAIENTGGGGAFDVATGVTLPLGLQFAGGSLGAANLSVYRGDGTQLVAGVDYSVSGNVVTFLDAGNVATLLPGRTGTAADTSGANLVVITYDTIVGATIPAASTLQTTATLSNYASVNNGTDFTPIDITDTANEQVASPTLSVQYAGGSLDNGDSSAAHTTGSDLVIGESMQYDIVVTLPEGSTQNLRLDDLIPTGLQLDTSFNGGQGFQLITTAAGSAALGADFNGTVGVASLVGGRWTFNASSATADNVAGNNTFAIRVQLVASDVASNQAGVTLANSGQLVFSDPDADTPNGAAAAAVDRTVAQSGAAPTVTIREPTLVVTQTTATNPGLGVDQGDTVEYDITIRNGNAATDFNAFDIGFLDALPAELGNVAFLGATYQGGATNNGGVDFELAGGQLRTASGANIDIAKGGSITLRVSGTVLPAAASEISFNNTATAQWTSLDGTAAGVADPAGERTGIDGTLNSGVLNDYRATSTLTVPVAQAVLVSRVGGLPDTAAASPANGLDENVTVGELVRYRVVALLSEGTTSDYSLQVTLQNGLAFTNDGTTRIVFISNNGLSTDITNLITGGVLNVTGNQTSAQALAIPPDLSGAAPTGVFNPADITVSTDASGNQVVTFRLGTLVNQDSDIDREGISLEFNARVLNQASNAAGAVLSATVVDRSGTTNLSTAETVREDVVEPSFTGMTKQVYSFDPASGTPGVGTADVDISFTQSGASPAYNVVLTDSFPTASGYAFDHLVINGVSFTAAQLAGIGVNVNMTNGLQMTFDRIDAGSQISVFYSANAPDSAPIAATNATLTWTSLPDNFTTWGGSGVGASGAADGERTGSGASPNTYVRQAGAGLGVIAGTLWDDTASANASAVPDGPGLAGQPVTLTWAGVDGNLATTADNLAYTTTTDANGQYHFGVLPLGTYQIQAPTGTLSYPQPVGALAIRIDTDTVTPLGTVGITLADGGTAAANAGYVEQNDAPVNQLPATSPAGLEDTAFSVAGITISDVDAGAGTMQVTLSALHGTLSLSALPAGVTESGANTAALTLTGNLTSLNAALANLLYLGQANYNGTDTLTINTNDRGNFGDRDGNGIPGELTDALAVQSTLPIVVVAVNDAPVAVGDAASATEAGGTANALAGVNPIGNVLANDTDVDIATNGDALRVVSAANQNGATVNLPGIGSNTIAGVYGTLTIGANGAYQYTVDNSNAAVQALRQSGQTLTEQFTYRVFDTSNAAATGALTLTIHGANDSPVGVNDVGSATEAGGVFNGTAGSNATGAVLTNDTDVDSVANGETKQVTGITNQPESVVNSPLAQVAAGTTSATGTSIAGAFGTLTIGADGTYRYVVDNNNAAVQQLVPTDAPLIDTFTYRITDAGGLSDLAEVQIQIHGSNDNPVASDDQATAIAGSAALGVNPVNPSGNVITVASRPGTVTQPGGNGIDTDVDHTGQPNTLLTVNGVRTGLESAGGVLGAVAAGTTSLNGATLAGSFGTLHIGANGSYTYDVDSNNLLVRALAPGATLSETFTYQITDSSGLTDRAQLVITVTGVNDPPVARNDTALAIEAGGVDNATAGLNPVGSVLTNDTDIDRDALTVNAVRTGAEAGSGATGTLGQPLQGLFGTLTLNANGGYRYVVNNASAAVQALRLPTDQLVERFTYTIADTHGATDQAELDIVISGRNDAPVAQNDQATAVEAGGVNNGTPGVNPSANLLTNDTDVDAADTKTIDGIQNGGEATATTFAPITATTSIAGVYGTLTISPNGSYAYTVDNTLPAVQRLTPGASLVDVFSYRMHDAAGATDVAQLNVQIQGAWDTPVARDDFAIAVANNGVRGSVNPTGNVLTNDTDVDAGDLLDGTGARVGPASAGGPLLSVVGGSTSVDGRLLQGQFGDLVIGANGSYIYRVDAANPTLIALGPLQTVNDVFTYQVTDEGGLSTTATLTVVVRGRNEAPVGAPDAAVAVEAGGIGNAAPGVNPSGSVLANDTDAEGDALHVAAVRTGAPAAAPGDTVGAVGSVLRGTYGDLTLNADGTWNYVVDNALPAVQALRTSGQTLQDVFTYTLADVFDARGTAELRITIEGQNDTPVANSDAATAIEAGGVNNGTPGQDARGNVLANDTDVDSIANGETKQVVEVSNEAGGLAVAGAGLAGNYGRLTLNADGTYDYVVDNANAAVQALRTRDDTLTEVFVYRMRDAAGAQATASLTIQIRGADDTPVARDDGNVATDQTSAPQAAGNVLANDTDVDGNDHLTVAGVRTGEEAGTGTAGTPGQALTGRYGTLTLNPDGSYTYQIDLSNPQVLAAAGLGQVLQDPFTYTVRDDAGATDQAQLVITLDIATPYIPPPGGEYFLGTETSTAQAGPLIPALDPVVYVTPEVEQDALQALASSREADGSQIGWPLDPGHVDAPVGVGLGFVPGEFVGRAVRASQRESAFDRAWIFGRPGRTSLSADGLLPDPSVFAPLPDNLTEGWQPLVEQNTAQGFSTQLREAALKWPLALGGGGGVGAEVV